jgi:hypothetical protein
VPPSNMHPHPGWELVDDPQPLPLAYPVPMRRITRVALVLMVALLVGVFVIAAWIRPYDAAGNPRTMATHTQLGLPECNMVAISGRPCPSCGMTTSFSLLIHGDVRNSLRANWVGTLLALFWLALIPWGVVSAFRGRLLWVRNVELVATVAVGVMLALMLGRWGWILLIG